MRPEKLWADILSRNIAGEIAKDRQLAYEMGQVHQPRESRRAAFQKDTARKNLTRRARQGPLVK